MNQSLLTLICSPSLERPINNWLLEHESISGFTTKQAYGHGSKPDTLNIIEQVEGRKKQTVFQIHVTSEIAEVIINDLKKDFKVTDIHYWLVPVIAAGQLDHL